MDEEASAGPHGRRAGDEVRHQAGAASEDQEVISGESEGPRGLNFQEKIMKAKTKSPKTEVRILEQRIGSAEAIQRFSLRITFDSLAKAERLRQAARAYQRAFATRKEGRARAALFQLLNILTTPFHKPIPARDMRKVRKFLKGGRR